MKPKVFIFWPSLLAVCVSAIVFATGCGNRTHSLKQTTAYIGGDGETNRVVNVEFESGIRLTGQKLELADLELTESVGKDGWQYGVGASSASSSPESIAMEALVDAFKSSQLAQARQPEPALSEEDKALLSEIPALREDMAAIREALKNNPSGGE